MSAGASPMVLTSEQLQAWDPGCGQAVRMAPIWPDGFPLVEDEIRRASGLGFDFRGLAPFVLSPESLADYQAEVLASSDEFDSAMGEARAALMESRDQEAYRQAAAAARQHRIDRQVAAFIACLRKDGTL